MKTTTPALLFSWIAVTSAFAAAPAKVAPVAPASGEKTHTLFMGVDISVEHEKMFRRVREVSGSSWVVNVDGRPEFIPTAQKALSLKVEQSLKLTEATATLTNVKTERAYTLRGDPKMQAMRSQLHMEAYASEQKNAAEIELARAQEAVAWSTRAPTGGGWVCR